MRMSAWRLMQKDCTLGRTICRLSMPEPSSATKKILGLSVSTTQELAAVDIRLVDHLGIGPIFSTSTKPDASAALGLGGFAALASRKPCPVVAIGSVKVPIVGDLIQAGADGVAVVSAICGQANPGEATKKLVRAVQSARR